MATERERELKHQNEALREQINVCAQVRRALHEEIERLQTEGAHSARSAAFEHVLSGWESAYPESVFPPLKDGELAHAMRLCNAEDKNQSARLYAEWARHIVKCIRHQVEAEAPMRGAAS